MPVAFNQNITANYVSTGTKTWKYKLTLANNTVLYSQSLIKIEPSIKPGKKSARDANSNSCFRPDEHITATTAYLGEFGKVKLTIDDADCDGIKKPLIVAEGFDMGAVFSPENPEGQYDYDDFRNFLLQSGTELMDLIRDNNKDYDIIFVDWDNGVDYLQRNAYALEAVIAWVNQQKANNFSTEDNVILGQSMGGVIARWALADMEERNIDHDTRLFISQDAPQQGANIPMSVQYMYRHINNQYIETSNTLLGGLITIPILESELGASNYLSLLDVPATQQLLKNRANLSYGLDNDPHDTFYTELRGKGLPNSGGYPINCRNIAISNGSECGINQDFEPGDYLVNLYSDTHLSFLEDLASLVILPLGGNLAGLLVDSDFFGVALLGLIPGNSRFNINIWAKAIPYGTGNKIYNGDVSYSKKVLWIGPTIVTHITQVELNQPANVLPFDTYGGGFYNISNSIDFNDLPDALYLRDKFNFITTVSALDIGNGAVALYDSDYLKNYVGGIPPSTPKDSPFVNFSTEFDTDNPNVHNKQHISFNTRNGDWLALELDDQTGNEIGLDCSFVCSNNEIMGLDKLCDGIANFYVPSGADSYSWSILNTNIVNVISNTDTRTLTVSRNGTNSGWINFSVTIESDRCGDLTLHKQVYVGEPIGYLY